MSKWNTLWGGVLAETQRRGVFFDRINASLFSLGKMVSATLQRNRMDRITFFGGRSVRTLIQTIWGSRILLLILRWIIAGVFIYAGVQKIIAPLNFADSIASFLILPNGLINLVALSLPPFEILLALAVVFGIQPVLRF